MTTTANIMFPGRPSYWGPLNGPFGLLHHNTLIELSHNVRERVAYVKLNKPPTERDVRLYNMIYLGGCEAAIEFAAFDIERQNRMSLIWADNRWNDAECVNMIATIRAEFLIKIAALESDIITYVRAHIPDCAWDGQKLVFPEQD